MALQPYQLSKIPNNIVNIYNDLENFIIEDIARRISKAGMVTETAEWQSIRAQEVGISLDNIKKEVARITLISEKEIDNLFKDIVNTSIGADNAIYSQAKLTPIHFQESEQLQEYLIAAVKQTKGELRNLTQSLGFCTKGIKGNTINKKLTAFYQ
ncbi:MAG: phage minor capsid protein, partial [Clostridium sp.]